MRSCGNCAFAEDHGPVDPPPHIVDLRCHRFPPAESRRVYGETHETRREHPYVQPWDWCGEFRDARSDP